MTSRVDINSDPYELMGKLQQMISMAGDYANSAEQIKESLTATIILDRLCVGDDKFGDAFRKNLDPEKTINALCDARKQGGESLTSVCDVAITALQSLSLTDKAGGKAAEAIDPPSV